MASNQYQNFIRRDNVATDRLTLLLRIGEKPGSNLCPDTGYPVSLRDFP